MSEPSSRDEPRELPADLPQPVDDGGARHLARRHLPRMPMIATDGWPRWLDQLSCAVLFFFPRTGLPGSPAGPAWNAIPGARGCTPQALGFRDLHARFSELAVEVYGVSTQSPEYQRTFKARNDVPFEFLSDCELRLTRALALPTFEFPVASGGPRTLIKRMAWYVVDGWVVRVWYPVFPPQENAQRVLEWLEGVRR